jgi:hypothetical protein
MAAHFPNFEHLDVRTSGAVIRLRHGRLGPPLPSRSRQPAETSRAGTKIAARLARATT